MFSISYAIPFQARRLLSGMRLSFSLSCGRSLLPGDREAHLVMDFSSAILACVIRRALVLIFLGLFTVCGGRSYIRREGVARDLVEGLARRLYS